MYFQLRIAPPLSSFSNGILCTGKLIKNRFFTYIGPMCNREHTTCIDSLDLDELVRARREYANRGAFHRIYPSAHLSPTALANIGEMAFASHLRIKNMRYRTLPDDPSVDNKRQGHGAVPTVRSTWRLHRMLLQLAKLEAMAEKQPGGFR